MTGARTRPTIALALAATGGVFQGALSANVPLRLADGSGPGSDLAISEISAIVGVLGLLSLAVLLGLFAAGYVWGGRTAHAPAFGRFGGTLLGVAGVGFGVGFLAVSIALGHPVGRHAAAGRSIYEVVEAANGLVRIPVAGMAGGAFALYLEESDPARRQHAGSGSPVLFAGALVLAGIAGLLLALERNAPFLVADRGLSIARMNVTLGAVSLASFGVTICLFVVGYWWAVRADVPARFGRFTSSLIVAVFGGLAIGMLPVATLGGPSVGVIVSIGFMATGAMFVPLSGLAGAAMAK